MGLMGFYRYDLSGLEAEFYIGRLEARFEEYKKRVMTK